MSEDKGWGWFPYPPRRESSGRRVKQLNLVADGETPFEDEDGPLPADFGGLHARYGLSRELFDAIVAWHTSDRADQQGHRKREHKLWKRLRREVPHEVFVRPADYVPHPVRVRMFVDDASGIALWPDDVGWPPRASFDEETLPISDALRADLQAWLNEYTDGIGGAALDEADHARRGEALSRRLQDELGRGYRVEYRP